MKSQQIDILYSRIWNPILTDEKNSPKFKADRRSKWTLFCFMNVNLAHNSVMKMCTKLQILLHNLET